jgi:hypothetical protein
MATRQTASRTADAARGLRNRRIDGGKIISTGEILQRRIAERLPTSSLCSIAADFVLVARSACETAQWLGTPRWLVRAAAGLCLLSLLAGPVDQQAGRDVGQGFDDPITLSAVTEIEELT